MPDVSETVTEAVERDRESHSHLNSAVAILVALTATFMALCNVKDGNVTQAMTQAQAQAVDTWSYYQSKSIKGHLAEQTVDQMRIQRGVGENAFVADPVAREVEPFHRRDGGGARDAGADERVRHGHRREEAAVHDALAPARLHLVEDRLELDLVGGRTRRAARAGRLDLLVVRGARLPILRHVDQRASFRRELGPGG